MIELEPVATMCLICKKWMKNGKYHKCKGRKKK